MREKNKNKLNAGPDFALLGEKIEGFIATQPKGVALYYPYPGMSESRPPQVSFSLKDWLTDDLPVNPDGYDKDEMESRKEIVIERIGFVESELMMAQTGYGLTKPDWWGETIDEEINNYFPIAKSDLDRLKALYIRLRIDTPQDKKDQYLEKIFFYLYFSGYYDFTVGIEMYRRYKNPFTELQKLHFQFMLLNYNEPETAKMLGISKQAVEKHRTAIQNKTVKWDKESSNKETPLSLKKYIEHFYKTRMQKANL